MNKQKRRITFYLLIIAGVYVMYTIATASTSTNRRLLSVKGGEVENLAQWTSLSTQISDLPLGWARIHVRWDLLQDIQTRTTFSGIEYDKVVKGIRMAKEMGAQIVLTIKGVPYFYKDHTVWATATNGTPTPVWPNICGRMSVPSGLDGLKTFIVNLNKQLKTDGVLTTSDVLYIELWNEPDDVAYMNSGAEQYHGCWVDPRSPTPMLPGTPTPTVQARYLEGGQYYAQVLNSVAPYVRSQVQSQNLIPVKFVAGSVANANNGFLGAIMANPTAMANSDVISYHQYVTYVNECCGITYVSGGCPGQTLQSTNTYIDTQKTSFAYVRGTLDGLGGTPKPILISEGAMKYSWLIPTPTAGPSPTPTPNRTPTPGPSLTPTPYPTPNLLFPTCQAYYAADLLSWAQTENQNSHLLGFVWYTVGYNGWANTDLLNPDFSPRPVYHIWKDLGPVAFYPIMFKDYNGSLLLNMSSGDDMVTTDNLASSGDAYPLPGENPGSEANSGQTGTSNPYPLPGENSGQTVPSDPYPPPGEDATNGLDAGQSISSDAYPVPYP